MTRYKVYNCKNCKNDYVFSLETNESLNDYYPIVTELCQDCIPEEIGDLEN